MAVSRFALFGLFCVGFLMVGLGSAATARFDELFQPTSSADHLLFDGEVLRMKLDNYSGSDLDVSLRFDDLPVFYTCFDLVPAKCQFRVHRRSFKSTLFDL